MTLNYFIFLLGNGVVVLFFVYLHRLLRIELTRYSIGWALSGYILVTAARLLRQNGPTGVAVADLLTLLYVAAGLGGLLYFAVYRAYWPYRHLDKEALINTAYDLSSHGQRQQAIRALEQLVARDPHSARARYGLGLLLNEEGKSKEALPHLKFASELVPTSVDTLMELGRALRAIGENSKAVDVYTKAVLLEPDNPSILAELNDLTRT